MDELERITMNYGELPAEKYPEEWERRLPIVCPDGYFEIGEHEGSGGFEALKDAVNQGIDSHLEAVFFEDRGTDAAGRRVFAIEADSLKTLIRRLADSADEDANDIASCIVDIHGFEWV